MATNTEQVGTSPKAQIPGLLLRAWYFVRHFVEMCLAMCIGGIPLIMLFFWAAARLGFPDLSSQSPELSVLAIGVILTVPMTLWMRFRHHAWQTTLEMAGSSIILAVLLIVGSLLGILARTALIDWISRLACLAMLVPMVLRLDHYTADHAGHQHHTKTVVGSEADPHAHHHPA